MQIQELRLTPRVGVDEQNHVVEEILDLVPIFYFHGFVDDAEHLVNLGI